MSEATLTAEEIEARRALLTAVKLAYDALEPLNHTRKHMTETERDNTALLFQALGRLETSLAVAPAEKEWLADPWRQNP
jgi:hypothetical protein